MRLGELLRRVPGVEKRFVHYLESQGYIRPTRVRKQRIDRREYSEDDLQLVRRMWAYYQRGLSPQAAFERASNGHRSEAIALLAAPGARWDAVLGVVQAAEAVVEATGIYGDATNLLLRLVAVDDLDLYRALAEVIAQLGLPGAPRLLRLDPAFERRQLDRADGSGPVGMMAYVLIKVPHTLIASVLERLRDLEGVTEATATYGETDIIAKIEVPSQAELDDLVMHRIQGIEAVESTRTFIAVGGMHWRRPS